jgi:hypothetical protein
MEMIYSRELGLRIAQDAKTPLRSGAFSHYRFFALFLYDEIAANGNDGKRQ